MEGRLIMSTKELKRKTVMESVKNGHITLMEASKRLSISYRQTLRIFQRFLAEGDAGFIHKNFGRKSSHSYPSEYKEKILARYKERYWDFGPTFASEKLVEDNLPIHHETLRLWLKETGLWVRHRKRSPYRRKRKARLNFGELIQMDGSFHDWFEADETQCLVNMVDDATKKTFSLMDNGETTHITLMVLKCWVEKYGIPLAVYVDKKSVYISQTHLKYGLEEAESMGQLSEFARVCRRLDIEIIIANSPQAKGRVERKHGVYQDRFIKELRLKGIKSISEANAYLQEEYLEKINQKFSICRSEIKDVHRNPKAYGDLNQIFCIEETRFVGRDYTVRYDSQYYQLKVTTSYHVKPGKTVIVRRHLDNSVSIWRKEIELEYEIIQEPKKKAPENKVPRKLKLIARGKNNPKSPWRKFGDMFTNAHKKKGHTAA
jgi:transposase